jgi:hypothetical protein
VNHVTTFLKQNKLDACLIVFVDHQTMNILPSSLL